MFENESCMYRINRCIFHFLDAQLSSPFLSGVFISHLGHPLTGHYLFCLSNRFWMNFWRRNAIIIFIATASTHTSCITREQMKRKLTKAYQRRIRAPFAENSWQLSWTPSETLNHPWKKMRSVKKLFVGSFLFRLIHSCKSKGLSVFAGGGWVTFGNISRFLSILEDFDYNFVYLNRRFLSMNCVFMSITSVDSCFRIRERFPLNITLLPKLRFLLSWNWTSV